MNNRNRILLALLLLQLVLIGYVHRPGQQAAGAEHAFFPGLAPEEVHKIAFADENGATLTLAKEKDGWQIAAVSGPGAILEMAPPVPADDAKVEALVRNLAGLASDRLVSRTRGSQARLKVAEDRFIRRVELTSQGGDQVLLYLGSAPSFNTIHARTGGASEVYLAEGITAWEAATDLSSWWRTEYLDLEPKELQEVTLANKEGTLQLARSEDEGWQLAGGADDESLSQAAVAEFLNQVSYLTVSDYVGRVGEVREAAHGLSRPAARLVLETGREKVELRIGPEVRDSDERVVKSSVSPYYVKVTALSLQPLLEQTKKALLAGGSAQQKRAAKAE